MVKVDFPDNCASPNGEKPAGSRLGLAGGPTTIGASSSTGATGLIAGAARREITWRERTSPATIASTIPPKAINDLRPTITTHPFRIWQLGTGAPRATHRLCHIGRTDLELVFIHDFANRDTFGGLKKFSDAFGSILHAV
jgi:hypothetical protein